MSGVELIAAERERQVSVEGWKPEHDDTHTDQQLLDAAIAYADPSLADIAWPWDIKWWKPSDDPVRNLVKAGALIAAEIDRLQRVAEDTAHAR